MPSTTLQSRITAFESLSGQSHARPPLQKPMSPRVIPSTPPRASPSPSPPNLGRKSSLLDLKIDLKDWVLDDGSPPRSNGFRKTPTQALFNANDSLIHFSPPKPSNVKAPPLPPRKPSLASLKSVTSTSSLPLTKGSSVPPPLPRRGDSLTVEHTYPPTLEIGSGRGHTHGSSVSSFHSVSLSEPSTSPGAADFPQHMTGSSAESFEELSASTSLASPTTSALISSDWEKAMARRKITPPKLPARPPSATTTSPPARRTAPPPPSDRASIRSNASDRASIASTSTSASVPRSSTLTSRAPPIPAAPRRPRDASARSRGWRGLSVDLIPDPNASSTSPAGPDDADDPGTSVLAGPVVRVLWARSRLPTPVLSAIWTECDTGRTGVLDRDAFARGMWRIDEELRRASSAGTRRRGMR
ncbi:hypothetical protein C8J57DRAFT_1496839 [Mycena rebaudengoi]|nr:hypothetical protein C8J57DRAFT_1496839 [Mycena rebaudengoi]